MKSLVVFLGTHCSGKSSYAREMLNYNSGECKEIHDGAYKITVGKDVFALGHYHNQCGGADGMGALQKTKTAIVELSTREESVMVAEGVLLLSEPVFNEIRKAGLMSGRQIFIVYLEVPEEEAMKRVKIRNGGKNIGAGLINKKRYYDKRILELEKRFPDFKFLYIKTQYVKPIEAIMEIRKMLY